MISFEIGARDPESAARAGKLVTPRNTIETPVFMPVGTSGAVKALTHDQLEQLNAAIILGNTYHLYLRPGVEIIGKQGGLHEFIGWKGSLLTDSGGYQVFSHRDLSEISEEGVRFKSHLDGSMHFFSPEKSIEVQRALGADIVMAFDDCTPYPVDRAEARRSMELSMRWARRCIEALETDQALFGIVQGSIYEELRRESIRKILDLDPPGVAMGGFSVGEPKRLMHELLDELKQDLPEEKPHYLMGVGTPVDLVLAVEAGYDMFDCVLPTRNARNGTLFTWKGKIRIKNQRFRDDGAPIDPDCACFVCRRYSRAYLRHLFLSKEISASIMNSYHNLYFYLELMAEIRRRIRSGGLSELRRQIVSVYGHPGGVDS